MTPPERAGDTRERVLEAALDAFAEGGLEALSIRAIQASSGVSVGSLYHHFGSQRGILVAVYERCLFDLLDHLAPAAAEETAVGLVEGMVGRYLDWVEADEPAARLVLSAAPAELSASDVAGFAQRKAEVLGPIVGRALQLADAGALRRLPVTYYELLVIGPVAETARRWLAGVPLDLVEAREVLVAAILRALRP